jgi:hypothetical protein
MYLFHHMRTKISIVNGYLHVKELFFDELQLLDGEQFKHKKEETQ